MTGLEEKRNAYRATGRGGALRERDNLKDVGVEMRIICILKKYDGQ
jgi:hypothetical protein